MTSTKDSSFGRSFIKFSTLAAVAILLPAVAYAQDDAKPAAKPAPAKPAAAAAAAQPDGGSAWVKVCRSDQASKQKACVTSVDIRGENGAFISTVTIQQVGDEQKYGMGILVPLGVLLQPGVALSVDGAAKAKAAFTICLPNPPVCVSSAPADQGLIDGLRKGGKLTMTAQNAQGKEVAIDVSLTGFAKVFDGPGIDPQQAEAQQKDLNDALQKRAEEARQKLIEQQKAQK